MPLVSMVQLSTIRHPTLNEGPRVRVPSPPQKPSSDGKSGIPEGHEALLSARSFVLEVENASWPHSPRNQEESRSRSRFPSRRPPSPKGRVTAGTERPISAGPSTPLQTICASLWRALTQRLGRDPTRMSHARFGALCLPEILRSSAFERVDRDFRRGHPVWPTQPLAGICNGHLSVIHSGPIWAVWNPRGNDHPNQMFDDKSAGLVLTR
jgi:hypothetical protein